MEHEVVTLAHGAGGQMSHALMEEIVLPELGNRILNTLHDGAVLPIAGRAAFTTDSYVVQPHFFPGGSIGRLAVCGTVNDLAMTGAVPRWLSLAVILEEGFPIATLRRIVRDIRTAVEEAEAAGADAEAMSRLLGKGRAKKGIFEGDLEEGELEIGQAAALLSDIRPVSAIMDDLIRGYRQAADKSYKI